MVSPTRLLTTLCINSSSPPLLLSRWSLNGAAFCSPNPLLFPAISSGSVVCLQALAALIIHTVPSSAWHLTTRRCVSPAAQRTLATRCSTSKRGARCVIGTARATVQWKKGVTLTCRPLFTVCCQEPPPQWLHYKPPYSHNLTEQACNSQYP